MSRWYLLISANLHGEFRAMYIVEASRLDLPKVVKKPNESMEKLLQNWAISRAFVLFLLSMSHGI